MTHKELLENLKETLIQEEMEQSVNFEEYSINQHAWKALIAVVDLHKPDSEHSDGTFCNECVIDYPCQTIQAIEKELS